jgi:hypothetical protein
VKIKPQAQEEKACESTSRTLNVHENKAGYLGIRRIVMWEAIIEPSETMGVN